VQANLISNKVRGDKHAFGNLPYQENTGNYSKICYITKLEEGHNHSNYKAE